jgi:hypothetical protein
MKIVDTWSLMFTRSFLPRCELSLYGARDLERQYQLWAR